MDVSRRGLFSFLGGSATALVAWPLRTDAVDLAPASAFPQEGYEIAQVKWYNRARGFGFLRGLSSGHDILAHCVSVRASGLTELRPGQTVAVHWTTSPTKGPIALELKLRHA